MNEKGKFYPENPLIELWSPYKIFPSKTKFHPSEKEEKIPSLINSINLFEPSGKIFSSTRHKDQDHEHW